MHPRTPDWPERLDAHCAARADRPFAWGRRANDCASAAAAWVLDATGHDALAHLPDWTDETGARIAIRAAGGLRRGVASQFPEIASAHAGRGDLALVRVPMSDTRARLCVGVLVSEGVAAPGRHGLAILSRGAIVRAYRVGAP